MNNIIFILATVGGSSTAQVKDLVFGIPAAETAYVGLYSDNGSATAPVSLLFGTLSPQSFPLGTDHVSFTNEYLQPGNYWIALSISGTTAGQIDYLNSGSSLLCAGCGASGLPTTAGTTFSTVTAKTMTAQLEYCQ